MQGGQPRTKREGREGKPFASEGLAPGTRPPRGTLRERGSSTASHHLRAPRSLARRGLRPAFLPRPNAASPRPSCTARPTSSTRGTRDPAPQRRPPPGGAASAASGAGAEPRARRLHFGAGAARSSPACRALAPPPASGPWRAAAAGRRPLLPSLGLPAPGRRRRRGLEGQSGGEAALARAALPPSHPTARPAPQPPPAAGSPHGRGAEAELLDAGGKGVPSAALPCPPGS